MTIVDLSARLDDRGVAHAVIGAFALAVHGVLRASDDIDVLVMDRRCLEAAMWEDLEQCGVAIEIRRGDADDPLAGVTRLQPAHGTRIDVIVGKAGWQRDVLERGHRTELMGGQLPIALPADLILLKLYAGGPQDAWDIDQMLDVVPDLTAEIETRLPELPKECAALWHRILGGRTSP